MATYAANSDPSADSGDNYLTHTRGVASWLFTLDHKRIGVMYLIAIMASLGLGGAFAALLRTELFSPGPTIMSADTYNHMFTLHGAVMIFLFIIPGIPAARVTSCCRSCSEPKTSPSRG